LRGRNNSVFLKVIITLFLFSGFHVCFGSDIPDLPENTTKALYDKKWEKYGAYYDIDEMIYTTIFSTEHCITRYEINKKIKILTTEGAQYGTIPVHQQASQISKFEPHLFGADGVEIPLDVKKIRKEYLETGKVIFPKVMAGCYITLKIVFNERNLYYLSEWYEFTRNIPVRIGRFVHSSTDNTTFDYKITGNRCGIITEDYSKFGNVKAWIVKDLEPLKDLDYLNYESITEPKIILKILKVKSWNRSHNSKKDIFNRYKDECSSIEMQIGKDPLFNATSEKITGKGSDDLSRASEILAWVQNTISSIGYNHDQFSNLFETNKASFLQIACICNKLFNKSGLQSEIVFAFDKDDFILDTNFLFYTRFVITAFPVVTINNTKYVTYPYLKGYELGEYPMGYRGALCFSAHKKEIYPLPPQRHGKKYISEKRVIDLNQTPAAFQLLVEFRQYSASDYREDLLDKDKEKQKKYLEKWVKNYKCSNELESFSFENLNKADKPLIVKIKFKNDDIPIPYENKKIFKLTNFFEDYFEDITPDRTEDVYFHSPATYIDEIEVLKIPGKKITFDIKTEQIGNTSEPEVVYYVPNQNTYSEKPYNTVNTRLFSVSYMNTATDSSYIFQRKLTVNPTHITKNEISKVYNDCVKINSIKNSSFVIE